MKRSFWPRPGKPVATKNNFLTTFFLLGIVYVFCWSIGWASRSKFSLLPISKELLDNSTVLYTTLRYVGKGPETDLKETQLSTEDYFILGSTELSSDQHETDIERSDNFLSAKEEPTSEFTAINDYPPGESFANGEIASATYNSSLKFIQGNKSKCIIGVASSVELLQTLNLAALQTWVRPVETFCDVRFFVGRGEISQETLGKYGSRIIQLDIADAYPPLEKVFNIWHVLWQNAERYEWLAKVDSDTYVHVGHLQSLLFNRFDKEKMTGYYGIKGNGLPEERQKLGIVEPYCLGMGYFIGRKTLLQAGPHFLDECMKNHCTNHSDTEVGRCIQKHSGLACATAPINFLNMYWHIKDGYIHGRTKAENMQLATDFPEFPPKAAFDSTLLHAFKSPERMRHFHRQVMHYLRAVFPTFECHENFEPSECVKARYQIESSCVNNPIAQLEATRSAVYLNECPSLKRKIDPHTNIPVFIISPDNDRGKERFNATKDLLQRTTMLHNIQRFVATENSNVIEAVLRNLTLEEVGYRDTMLRLFTEAKKKRLGQIIVLSDNVRPHKNFTRLWDDIMANGRCGGHLWAQQGGGVLLLGEAVGLKGSYPNSDENDYDGWKTFDADMANTTRRFAGKSKPLCYNHNQRTDTVFAAMYHLSTYDSIVAWLTSEDTNLPFGHVLRHLARIGHIVRVAYPNMMRVNVSDLPNSSAEEKPENGGQLLEKLRWKEDDYVQA